MMPNLLLNVQSFFLALSPVTQFFIAVIVILFIGFNWKYSPRIVSTGPTILTTIGIFATFLGIAIGLYDFNSTNIQASVPSLLEGLRTAFWASVFGVGAAVLIKLRELFPSAARDAEGGPAGEVTGADIVRALLDVRTALAGEGEGSLVSQVKLARQDSNDRLDKLRDAQTQALQMLAQMGTGALVEALRSVIADFNDRITEQFGQNFAQLNTAVGRLLQWQENYKQTIETLIGHLETAMPLLGDAAGDIKTVVDSAAQFTDTANHLSATLSVLAANETRLNEVARGIVGVLDSAAGRIPEVEERLVEITNQMAAAVQQNQRDLHAALEASASSIQQMHDTSQRRIMNMANTATEALRDSQNSINDSIVMIKGAIQASQQDMARYSLDFNQQISGLIENTKVQVSQLEHATEAELKKSLETLAGQFTSISERFAIDYTPLAERLRRVLEIAERVSA